MTDSAELTSGQRDRRRWMGVLAKADPAHLAELWQAATRAGEPAHETVRAPEIGMVMTRGRAGGSGQAFNLGEMTVTRCAVRLADGAVGQSWVAGRSKEHARLAALCDGLMQGDAAAKIEAAIVAPLERAEAERRRLQARKAAATRVEFFTMVRGEDE
ncbi:phosphonate C-P lyase system protein PhnG [Minwuia thermotolerans]|uniref:Phosphonate C-P lyase system protein PhnG n=1 Tax=Minwuia thermotolerans TaxID=2056226 RepID=A0A2M9G3S5_9PROT|nr:phosphonate C-P lyase system protein PhnG [Minwuia thermotolerans]PJK30350.1 phosphonate C-P lyase system protein PhnG [Minwuia thermotolerans]